MGFLTSGILSTNGRPTRLSTESTCTSCYSVFERILHLGDLVFDLQQLPQHTLAVRAGGSRELPPNVPDLVRNICACELRNLLKVVWVCTSKWSAMFSKAEYNLGEAYTFHSNALPNCNDSSVTLMRPLLKTSG